MPEDLRLLWSWIMLGFFSIMLSGCAAADGPKVSLLRTSPPPGSTVCQLPGWNEDSHAEIIPAMRRSCAVLRVHPPSSLTIRQSTVGKVEDWLHLCDALAAVHDGDNSAARRLLERWLVPVGLAERTEAGILTGYYEVGVLASSHRTNRFRFPIYADPQSAGPGPTRAQIARGALRGKELLWFDNPVDPLWIELNGSGRAQLTDGSRVIIGYAGQNGHEARFITGIMAEHGIPTAERTSRAAVRKWAAQNPQTARRIIEENPSMVYFRLLEDGNSGSPGALGTPLAGGRSLAVDPRHVALGTLVWVDGETVPALGRPFRRILAAQDTGGAIRGKNRGDVFWGRDEQGIASQFKIPGRIIPLAVRSVPLSGGDCHFLASTAGR